MAIELRFCNLLVKDLGQRHLFLMSVGISGQILHVDDDRSMRDSMSMLLQTDGYVVNSAASGMEALQLASGGVCPDVLIVDFDLGHPINGAEVAERIPALLSYVPPTIMLTGNVRGAKIPRVIDIVVWLTCKPLNPQLLLAALPSLVQLSRATRKLLTRSA
jgi:CheY-like chemotaxis protein